jgi:hypothetical protein
VRASPESSTTDGFSTDDGWQIQFDRLVTALGDVRLEEDSCTPYGETRYEWLFDFTVATDEKVGIVYGLGTCDLEFRIKGPSNDTVLGAGVDDSDLVYMRTELTDAYTEDQEISLWVIGSAHKGDVEKRFEWIFRQDWELRECEDANGKPTYSVVELESGAELDRQIEVRGKELFRTYADDEAELQFDLYAGADTDNDGYVTLDELNQLPAPIPPESFQDEEDWSEDDLDKTLRDLIYENLAPRVARLAGGGACEEDRRGGRF